MTYVGKKESNTHTPKQSTENICENDQMDLTKTQNSYYKNVERTKGNHN